MNGAIMVLPRDGLKDEKGDPVQYDRACVLRVYLVNLLNLVFIIRELDVPVRAITEGFVLRSAASTHGEMFLGCPLWACGIQKIRSTGNDIGAVWRDKDGRLAFAVAVFDIIDRVTQGS